MRQTRKARRRGHRGHASLAVAILVLAFLIYAAWLSLRPSPARAEAGGSAGSPAGPATLTVSFVGDIMLGGTVGDLIESEGPLAPWQGVKDLLSASDLACGNLECPVGTTGTPVEGKTWTFRADPAVVEGLKASGLDVVSLANNHALDYGQECLLETIDLVGKGGLAVIGAGPDEKTARAPFILEKNGLRVGILATAELVPYPTWAASKESPGLAVDYYGWYPGIVASIKELAGTVDTVIVLVHWGDERTTVPAERLADIAQAMRDAGAHAIIGTHPHILEGIAYDGRVLTAYSLGNFVFSTRPDMPALQAGAILSLAVSKGRVESASVVPTQIVWGKTVPAEGAERDATISALSSLSEPFGTGVSEAGDVVPMPFADMRGHWARFTAGKLAARGSIKGYDDGTFRPENRITKGEFAAMFSRLVAAQSEIESAGRPEGFALCAGDSWAYQYLKFLAASGAVAPADPAWTADKECSKLEACVAMWKYSMAKSGTRTPADAQGLDAVALSAVTWAVNEGVLKGYPDGTLGLGLTVSRAEMAEILLRYLDR